MAVLGSDGLVQTSDAGVKKEATKCPAQASLARNLNRHSQSSWRSW